jgi:MGT family glycosyltransferase
MTPKKILFANVPFDGHFNPLTPLATHLLAQGHDVRWYTGSVYESRVKKLNIPFYPTVNALDISQDNLNELFPERLTIESRVAKLKYDLKHVFILRAGEYFEDIKHINRSFDFDVLIADVAFTAVPFVKHKLNKPVISIGVFPLPESSVDLAPNGMGQTPAKSMWGRMNQHMLRYLTDTFIFNESKKMVDALYLRHKMKPVKGNIFNVLCRESNLLLQSGTPGFEYYRSDLGNNVRFIGPLLPAKKRHQALPFADKIKQYKKVLLVTQGTVEKDPAKIVMPTIEAFKNDADVLVVATTGGSQTAALRARYPKANVIIEDFIPFNDIMPFAHVYVTNGGYGGVMLSIENKLPMVVAGVHEGKNEICARVGYFKLGVNLDTECPTAQEIRDAVQQVLTNRAYKESVLKLKEEFAQYDPLELTDQYLQEVLVKKERNTVLHQYGLFELEAA